MLGGVTSNDQWYRQAAMGLKAGLSPTGCQAEGLAYVLMDLTHATASANVTA